MPEMVARIALSQHDWDKYILIDKFYDDQDKFFEKINVVNCFQEVVPATSTASTNISTVECLTCYDEIPSSVS